MFFQVSGHNFHSVMMESCFIFTAFYIPDHIPEWKQNIKVTKTFPVPPRSRSSSGTLTGLHSTWQMRSHDFQWVLIRFCPSFSFFKCLSCSLGIYSQRENIPRGIFFPFLRHLEAVAEEDRLRHPSSFSFLAQVEPSYVPRLSLQFPKFKQLFHNRIPGSYLKCINRHVYCMCT